MRHLIFQQFLSLDGLAADGDRSTKFFESPVFSEGSDNDLLQEMQRFDTILLGRVTYQLFADFWPGATSEEQIVADKINNLPKIVFSNSIEHAPWGKWPEATVVHGDAVEAIRQLKGVPGKDMVLWGSISLSQDLIKANLIDEYQIRIVPIILGNGISQFKRSGQLQLELIESKVYKSGLLLVKYKPKR